MISLSLLSSSSHFCLTWRMPAFIIQFLLDTGLYAQHRWWVLWNIVQIWWTGQAVQWNLTPHSWEHFCPASLLFTHSWSNSKKGSMILDTSAPSSPPFFYSVLLETKEWVLKWVRSAECGRTRTVLNLGISQTCTQPLGHIKFLLMKELIFPHLIWALKVSCQEWAPSAEFED